MYISTLFWQKGYVDSKSLTLRSGWCNTVQGVGIPRFPWRLATAYEGVVVRSRELCCGSCLAMKLKGDHCDFHYVPRCLQSPRPNLANVCLMKAFCKRRLPSPYSTVEKWDLLVQGAFKSLCPLNLRLYLLISKYNDMEVAAGVVVVKVVGCVDDQLVS